ncbi:hypothetical protein KI387_020274, partial [Taxus chinensis]
MGCGCECLGSATFGRVPVPAISIKRSHNLHFTLPFSPRGSVCAGASGRRASSRKKIVDSPSPSPSPLLNNTTSFTCAERFDEEEEEEEEYRPPKLPGDEPDFWEGPQWDT